MTVQTNTNVASFNGNGVTQIFPIAFKFNNDADLVVLLVDRNTGSFTRLALNSDYTVSGSGEENGGLINLVTAPKSSQRIKVMRIVDILQLVDLRNQGKFFAEVHEDAFDLLTMIAQQHQADISSTIRVAESDAAPNRLPPAASRANKVMGFDVNGNPIGILPASGSGTELALDLANQTDPAKGSGMVAYGSVSVKRALDERVKTSHSQVDRLLNSAQITDLYIISHPTSSDGRRKIGVGVCFAGTDNPVAEYQFDQDADGWWRLFGAYTGYARRDASSDAGFEPVLTGTFIQSANATSTYTTTPGDKFTAYFQGRTAEFVTYCDDRGGRWRFRINGKQGPLLSTWRQTAGQYTMTIATNLDPDRIYKIEAEFVGADNDNPPSSGSARGWLIYRGTSNDYGPAGGLRTIMDREKTLVLDWAHARTPRAVISPAGINEFAFRVSEIGTSISETWVPQHGGPQVSYSVQTTILVDGKPVASGDFPSRKSIESIVFEQRYIFRHGGGSVDLGYVSTRHRIDRSGKLTFDWRILGLADFNMGTWYSAQLMTDRSVCPRLVFNNDNSVWLPLLDSESSISIPYGDTDSAAFVGISSSGAGIYHGVAIDVNYSAARALNKEVARPSTPMLLTTRGSGNVAKIYWRVANSYEFKAGETYQGGVTVAAVTGIAYPNELDIESRGSIL